MSAVLSAVRSERSRPSTCPITASGPTSSPSRTSQATWSSGSTWQAGLLGTTGAGHDPGHAGHESGAAPREPSGRSMADRSPRGRTSSASAIATALRTAATGGCTSSRVLFSPTSRPTPNRPRPARRGCPHRGAARGRAGIGTPGKSLGSPTARGSPRVSSRSDAASSTALATSVRFRSSAVARSTPEPISATTPATALAAFSSEEASRTTPAQLVIAACSTLRCASVLSAPPGDVPSRHGEPLRSCDPHVHAVTCRIGIGRSRPARRRSLRTEEARKGSGGLRALAGRKGSRRHSGRRRPSPREASSTRAGWLRELPSRRPLLQPTGPKARSPRRGPRGHLRTRNGPRAPRAASHEQGRARPRPATAAIVGNLRAKSSSPVASNQT